MARGLRAALGAPGRAGSPRVQLNHQIGGRVTVTMAVRSALRSGKGRVSLGSGAWSGPYSFRSRFESGDGTNPEKLIGAAHAGCFSMARAAGLSTAGHTPERIHTTATVHIEQQDGGFAIPRIQLVTQARIPGIDANEFQKQAETAKANCPVSKALAGTKIELEAKLV